MRTATTKPCRKCGVPTTRRLPGTADSWQCYACSNPPSQTSPIGPIGPIGPISDQQRGHSADIILDEVAYLPVLPDAWRAFISTAAHWNAEHASGAAVIIKPAYSKPFHGITNGPAFTVCGRDYIRLDGGSVVLLEQVSYRA